MESEVTIPRQAQEAVDMAEKLHAQMFNQQEVEVPAEKDEEEVETTEVTDDGDTNVDDDTQTEYDVPHDDDVEELRKFKARYLTLKGMYDADVPRLHKELKELKQSVFEKFNSVIEEKAKTETPPKEETVDDLAKFEEEYGTDFVSQLRKLIANEASQLVKPVQEKVESVEDTQVKTAQTSFTDYLDQSVKGNWRDAWDGKDPKFQEFLEKQDPSGLYTYADLINLYNTQWDADRMSKIFNMYFEETATPEVPIVPKPAPQSRPDKEAMIAPSRTQVQSTPASEEKLIWTSEKLAEFQKLDRAGKYSKEESLKLWDDLLSAPAEGRFK